MNRWAGILIVLGILALVGALLRVSPPLPQAEFSYAIGDEIKTLDPAQMAWNEDIRMALSLWEGLTTYDPRTTEPRPGVAYLPPQISDDQRTYVFTLRPEARWSNGDPVTAQDFIYGWRRAMEPGTAADYVFLVADTLAGAADYTRWRNEAVCTLGILRDLTHNKPIASEDRQFIDALGLYPPGEENPSWPTIAATFRQDHLGQMNRRFEQVGLRALDDHHLEVRLARPTAYLLDLMAFSTFLPIHRPSLEKLRSDNPDVGELTLWAYDPQWIKPDYHRRGYPGLVTNGPFRITGWEFKRYIRLEKNPYYWDQKNVPLNSILARIMPEPSTAFLAYERGEVQWINELTRLDFAPKLIAQAQAGLRNDIHLHPAYGTYFYFLNCKPHLQDGSPNPLADPKLRMALNLAIDKQALVEKVSQLGNPPAPNFIPPGSIVGYQSPTGPGFNTPQAQTLLAEAGYPGGNGLRPLEILYNTGFGHERYAQAIAEMWQKNLGIQVSLIGKELKSYDEDRKNQRFMVCRGSWYGDYMDPTTFLDMMVTGNGNNDSAFSYGPYDDLMKQASQTADPAKRLAILSQTEALLNHEQMPILPLYYYVNLGAFRLDVRGIYENARNMHPFKTIAVNKF